MRTLMGRLLTAAGCSALVLGIAACEGSNLFSNGGGLPTSPNDAPDVEIVEPLSGDSYSLRDSIGVRVHVKDRGGIASVSIRGISFRSFPDSTQNSTEVPRFPEVTVPFPQGPSRALPKDTTILRFLVPNADTVSEPVFIIAEATDADGNMTADTVRIISGPRVVILSPITGSGARVNSDLLIRTQAQDAQVGLDSLKVYITGAQRDSFVIKDLAGTKEQIERLVTLRIGGSTGQITIRAEVFNTLGVRGTNSNAPVINITTQLSTDTVRPSVQRIVTSADRIELGDDISVQVTATDGTGSGISRLGAVVIVIPQNESASLPRDTFYMASRTYNPALSGTPDTTFTFQLSDAYNEIGPSRFPVAFTLQVHGFAIDAGGNCGASVQEVFQSLPCTAITGGPGGAFFIATGQTGKIYNPTAVVGTSVKLPIGSIIADAIVDTRENRVYLSNQGVSRSGVEVLSLSDTTLAANNIKVGSAPWGLFLVKATGAASDTLMVANSGGTNISFVPTSGSPNALAEAPDRRLLTSNEVLFEITESITNTFIRYTTKFIDFSDRPQFIAQDRNKVILYSTTPTSAALPGTIRRAVADPTPLIPGDAVTPESKILFTRSAVTPATATIAIAYVDSLNVGRGASGDDFVVIYDHVPGFPTQRIQSDPLPVQLAIVDIRTKGSDIFFDFGSFNLSGVGLRDTTYVANSGDLSTVAFGEGASAPTGRVILWQASGNPAFPEDGILSSYLVSTDLISNASDRVMGLSLNQDGSFGVGRGLQSTYFFSNDVRSEGVLRLQGSFSIGVQGGNGGVALHPEHTRVQAVNSDAKSLAFIATANKTIKIVDTFHYFERGEIPIRDNIVGQLRSALPNASVNSGIASTSCDFTVVQLFGVTSTNNIVIVNVRNRDIIKNTSITCVP